ncbi:hypothetical protein I4U23_020711 [Adineta vaga]|nr:hypothetical protein I4U23_020711 [Adineta vaga]
MDEQFDFRALLLKLQDCLSDNDRRRLHFIVGDTIPRQLRDDPTLGGTLNLLETLFDQAKISEQDFDYLIQVFREIHCHEAVKRLKEHQLIQHQRVHSGTTATNVSDILDDNDQLDKIVFPKSTPELNASHNSSERASTSSQATTISFDQNSCNDDKINLTKTSLHCDNKLFNVNVTLVKQIFKSKLTICQLILFFLNIIGISAFLLLLILFVKVKRSNSDILIIKAGSMYGNIDGGNEFNDAKDCSLNFNDKIMSISAGWTSDVLDFVTFSYTNDKSKQHGSEVYRSSPYTSTFVLESDEHIDSVSIYTSTRTIANPFSPNGTYLIVGLRFFTDRGRFSELFGSSNAIVVNETFSTYTLAYIRGRGAGYIDAIQFVWYRLTSPSTTATLSSY